MTTEDSQKSKKYVVTKLVRNHPNHDSMTEKQLCRFDTLEECAEYIVSKDEYWYKCRYGKHLVNDKLGDLVIKLKALKSDF